VAVVVLLLVALRRNMGTGEGFSRGGAGWVGGGRAGGTRRRKGSRGRGALLADARAARRSYLDGGSIYLWNS
jgi:hypothetical protein